MTTTNTGTDPFPIARTALEGVFGILRVLARKGLLTNEDFGELRAAFAVDAANLDRETFASLNHHVDTRFNEIRKLAAAAHR
ncbi:hypothetical protein [uncultured Sphingomonas sp.]|uniref:hypothetical protein n=1 Tax=uncultured Sphingomonas sp. TaxID=158754 RepID=UPI0025EF2B20|nr:hypothetical protein [uncultured Sphingomonas sp.]